VDAVGKWQRDGLQWQLPGVRNGPRIGNWVKRITPVCRDAWVARDGGNDIEEFKLEMSDTFGPFNRLRPDAWSVRLEEWYDGKPIAHIRLMEVEVTSPLKFKHGRYSLLQDYTTNCRVDFIYLTLFISDRFGNVSQVPLCCDGTWGPAPYQDAFHGHNVLEDTK